MQRLTLFMIVVVMLFDFLANGDRFGNGGWLPGPFSYFSELTSALALTYVVIVGTRDRFQFVRPAFWLAMGALLIVIICGVVTNGVGSGPIVAGIRSYVRAIPWFFLPAIFDFSEADIRKQLKWLLALSLLQIPVAIRQRIQTGDASWGFVAVTGDWTVGTLGDSGVLSVFLVCAVCIVAAMYERKQLTLKQFLCAFLALLTPTMINETKAMVLFLPVGMLCAFMTAADPRVRVKRIMAGLSFLLLFGALFVPVYDAMNADRQYGQSLGEFFLDPGNVESYVGSSAEIGEQKDVGRGDSIAVPLRSLAKDPVQLMFGYGIGNASDSSLGLEFGGRYADVFRPFMQASFSKFILELGVIGVTLLLIVYWMIFQDCRAVARADRGLMGAVAAGWTGVIGIMSIAMFYNKGEVFPSLSYLFWYFSGLVVARRMRLAAQSSERSQQSLPMSMRTV